VCYIYKGRFSITSPHTNIKNFNTLIMTHDIYEPCGSRMYGGKISQVLLWCGSARCGSKDNIWHSINPFCQIANTSINILTLYNKLYLTDKGLRTNGRIYNLS